jgi:PAS domain S-box-containing protein
MIKAVTLNAANHVEELNYVYQNVFQATSDAIWHWNLADDFVFRHGEHFRNTFGYDIVDAIFPTDMWYEVVHPEDMPRVMEKLQKVLQSPELTHWSDHYRYKRADGSYAFVLDTGYILRNEAGKAVTMIGALRDISETERAKQELIQSRNQYRRLFDSSPLAKLIYNTHNLHILEANAAALTQYGYTREEFLKLTLLDLHPRKEQRRVLHTAAPNGIEGAPYDGRWTHLLKNNENRIVEILCSPTQYETHDACIAVVNDITEKLRLQQQMVQEKILRQKEVTRAIINTQERERNEIATELHDNVNQVLTTIKLYLEIAQTDEVNRAALIEKSYRQTNAVIQEIRSLCRTIIAPTHTEPCLVQNIKDLVASYEPVNPFRLHFDPSYELPTFRPEISLTLFRITQEALNNVVKYAQAKNVWITLQVRKNVLRLQVRDDGIGFSTTRRRKGVGITNIQNRVSLYNGKCSIASSAGHGCSLEVEMPLKG